MKLYFVIMIIQFLFTKNRLYNMAGNAITSKNELLILAKISLTASIFGIPAGTPIEVVNARIGKVFRRGPYKTVKEIEAFIGDYSSIYEADIYCPQGVNRITGWSRHRAYTCKDGVIVANHAVNLNNGFHDEPEDDDNEYYHEEDNEDEDDPDF